MALDKPTLKNSIQAALDAESDAEVNPAEARVRTAQAIADAIDVFVKSGQVNTVVSVDPNTHAGTGQGAVT